MNDPTTPRTTQDVKYQFGRVYYEELVKRRRKLFALMITSFISVAIMFLLDGYMHIFFNDKYETIEALLTILGRLV